MRYSKPNIKPITPEPMVVVGVVGYVETPGGVRKLTVAWASSTVLNHTVDRRFYRHWFKSEHTKAYLEDEALEDIRSLFKTDFVMDDSILDDIQSLFDESKSDSLERGRV